MGRKLFFDNFEKIRIWRIFSFMFVLLSISSVYGATLHGTIYDSALEPVENAVVEMNTIPSQTHVAKQGTYSFTLSPGKYIINATRQSNSEIQHMQQQIIIKDNGDYIVDLILPPDLNDEAELLNEEINVSDVDFDLGYSASAYSIPLALIALAAIAFVAVYYLKKRKKPADRTDKKEEIDMPDETDKIIGFIEHKGGRATQKEIREEFPFSEAKISLMIADLEDRGLIRKIKRGKGNIIILNKK